MSEPNENSRLLKYVYTILVMVAVGLAVGRIFEAEKLYEPSMYADPNAESDPRGTWPQTRPPALPTFSSNDRSHWATVRALVDEGTFAIGDRNTELLDGKRKPYGKLYASLLTSLAANDPLQVATTQVSARHARIRSSRSTWRESGWEPGWDTVDKALNPETQKFYSTKPPLFPTIMAGFYWLLKNTLGWTFESDPWAIVKTIVLLVNGIPFAIYLALFSKLLDRFVVNEWAKIYLFAAACFATLVTPFLISINNHTISTFCVLFALYPTLIVLTTLREDPNESKSHFHGHFVAAGAFSALATTFDLPALAFVAGLGVFLLFRSPWKTLLLFVPSVAMILGNSILLSWYATGLWVPIYSKFGTEWYLFEGSHWAKVGAARKGIDYAFLKETQWDYVFHVMVGHHGIFSLTPIWLLSFVGMVIGPFVTRKTDVADTPGAPIRSMPWYFWPAVLLLSAIVIGFYLTRPETNRNYSGMSAGLRWLMWLTPLWLLSAIPVVDRMSHSKIARSIGYVFLIVATISATFPTYNPWRHPWLYRLLDAQGLLPY